MVKRVGDMTPEELAKHRTHRREMYAQNPERQRKYSRDHRDKQRGGPKPASTPARATYSPQDYADEWEWLTINGLTSAEIIDRSTPSKAWFKRHITPLVKYANCHGCGRKYLVARSGTLLTCGRDCPRSRNNETFRNYQAVKKELMISNA